MRLVRADLGCLVSAKAAVVAEKELVLARSAPSDTVRALAQGKGLDLATVVSEDPTGRVRRRSAWGQRR